LVTSGLMVELIMLKDMIWCQNFKVQITLG